MKNKRLTIKELTFIRDNSDKGPVWIAEQLGRLPKDIKRYAYNHGIQFERHSQNERNRHISTIDWKAVNADYAAGMTQQELGEKYNVHPNTIRNKVEHRKKTYQYWTAKELKQIKELHPNHTAKEIAEIMGRTPQSIREKIIKLGLKKYKIKQ